jgi:prepilin-type N-terminal cleavage/methylation domain-containing protein
VIKRTRYFSGSQGFTLVELIVTMAVFITVLMIAASAFNTIVTNASKYSKSEESNIEGMIGLEMMRHDLEQMGFGLPWSFGGSLTYAESNSLNTLDDAPNGAPRPFVGYDNLSTARIGVKASTVGTAKASQRWTYISFENYSAIPRESRPVNLGAYTPKAGDKVISLRTGFNDYSTASLRLSDGTFAFNYNANNGINDDFLPKGDQDTHFVYGIGDGSGPSLRMPFNRADFYLSAPSGAVPSFCAPGTKVLYKGTLKHQDGTYLPIPILDCVARMQVVIGWSPNSGIENIQDSITTYSSLPAIGTGDVTASGPITASDIKEWFRDATRIREQLKMVKVYVLAQEGKRDPGYNFPTSSMLVGGDGEGSLTSTYTFTAEQRHYRWKLYRIIVKPKNLVSNQR